jgi:hypothetical protein
VETARFDSKGTCKLRTFRLFIRKFWAYTNIILDGVRRNKKNAHGLDQCSRETKLRRPNFGVHVSFVITYRGGKCD